ncbi:MAG TPA: hypothetical protein VD813_10510 [Pseudonocardia sp.]|nr:hypothetical protein [Pseudonocardia sp.]
MDAGNGAAATGAVAPSEVRRLEVPESEELARLAAVFEDLQYVLRCCEHLVTALGDPAAGPAGTGTDTALVEALWTGALLGYARCFSARTTVLGRSDLDELGLQGDVGAFHAALLTLRDHYASRHVNPRETFSVGAAQNNEGGLIGVAVVSAPQPTVDDVTVRQLGRIAYGLSGLVDARMQEVQNRVLGRARELSPAQLAALPRVELG